MFSQNYFFPIVHIQEKKILTCVKLRTHYDVIVTSYINETVLFMVSMIRAHPLLNTVSKFSVIWPSKLIIQRRIAASLPLRRFGIHARKNASKHFEISEYMSLCVI